jgi:hypothetical protein
VLDYTVYLLVRIVVCIVQTLSWPSALALARACAWLMYRVDRRQAEGDAADQAGVALEPAHCLAVTQKILAFAEPSLSRDI